MKGKGDSGIHGVLTTQPGNDMAGDGLRRSCARRDALSLPGWWLDEFPGLALRSTPRLLSGHPSGIEEPANSRNLIRLVLPEVIPAAAHFPGFRVVRGNQPADAGKLRFRKIPPPIPFKIRVSLCRE